MTTRAKKRAKKPPAEPAAEPFFRPFSKLKKPRAAPGLETPALANVTAKRAAKPVAASVETAAPFDPDTFAMYMAGVRALPGEATRIPKTASRVEKAARAEVLEDDADTDARARMGALVLEGIRFETIDDGERIEGRRLDTDPRELRRLRRAQYAIDGKLDLHGLVLEEARRAVDVFVKKHAECGDKVVTIVHGKGTHSPRQSGVLRGEIGAWLSQGRSARYIRAFATAPADEGGAGAVLVLLAR